jgi:hypothetical protein
MEYSDEVLIIDRDEFPEKPAERAGTPHGFQPHRFAQRGKEIAMRLFPGYEDELLKQPQQKYSTKKILLKINMAVHQAKIQAKISSLVGHY